MEEINYLHFSILRLNLITEIWNFLVPKDFFHRKLDVEAPFIQQLPEINLPKKRYPELSWCVRWYGLFPLILWILFYTRNTCSSLMVDNDDDML